MFDSFCREQGLQVCDLLVLPKKVTTDLHGYNSQREDDNLFRALKAEHTGLDSAWGQERREEFGPKVYLPIPENNEGVQKNK